MTLRLIQVGLGGWGRNWYKAVVTTNPEVETVAWVEIVDAALQQAQQALKLPSERCFTSLEAALERVEADAVLITANLPGHVPSALTALRAGKHVLLEKPFAPTLAEAREVVDQAEQQDRILMISQNYRFARAVRVVERLVREQVLGPVGVVNIDFRRNTNNGPVEGNRQYQLWQPLLVDMSIHHFDLMRLVLGQEPTRVSCTPFNPPWSHFVEPPAATAAITFDGGSVVSYRGSWISTGPRTNWSGEWHMECEQGEIDWTSRGELPDSVVVRPFGKRPYGLKLPELAHIDRAGSLEAFVQAVKTHTTPETSGRDNLNTLALMYAAVDAINSGQTIEIAPGSSVR